MASIIGTNDDDVVSGSSEDDTIFGLSGADTISGSGGNDTIFGDGAATGNGPVLRATPLRLDIANARDETPDGLQVDYINAAYLPDGTAVLARVNLISKTSPHLQVDLAGRAASEILLNDNKIPGVQGEQASIRIAFFNQDTGAPIALSTVGTFGDIDRSGNGLEQVEIGAEFVSGTAASQTTDLDITQNSDGFTASGGTDTNSNDQDAWFSVFLDGQSYIEFTVTARGGPTGYTLNGQEIDDPAIVATPDGNDVISGGDGADVIYGNGGDDTILGGGGDDNISGGSGDDTISGNEGRDTIAGGDGDDTISGGDDADHIEGGAGRDLISGGDGDDQISGGLDGDVISGGAGADTILVGSAEDGDGDQIFGGNGGTDADTLDLRGSGPLRFVNLTPDADGNSQSGRVEFLDGDGNITGQLDFSEIETIIPCFTSGTRIVTPKGEVPVDQLKVGDQVFTRDNGMQEIRWIGKKTLSSAVLKALPHLQPILVKADSLGAGVPSRDLMLSPNHRLLMLGQQVDMLFNEPEVFSAAKHLTRVEGIDRAMVEGITYWHILFDRHEVILSNGAWSESFQPGDYSLKGVGDAQRKEIEQLFPQLVGNGIHAFDTARLSLRKYEAELLS